MAVEQQEQGTKPITLVFTDMVGSSAAKRAASLGPDASSRDRAYLAGIQSKHLRAVRDALAQYGGKEIMTIGDSFFLTFDDPKSAVLCCAAIQKRLRAEPISTPSGPLRLRIGIHVGTPEYFENSWHGTDVDTAARVESVGSAEQIILSDATRKAIGEVDGIRFRRLGTFGLKGVGNMVLWDADYAHHGLRRAAVPNNAQKRRSQVTGLCIAALIALAAVWIATSWQGRQRIHPNVSVLLSDFKNKSGDPVFDNALEQPLSVALEGAPFINIFSRNQSKNLLKEIGKQGKELDENSARLIAGREGIPYVISGDVAQAGNSYRVSAQVIDAISGRRIGSYAVNAHGKDAVLKSIPKLAVDIRKALGDTTPQSAELAAAETYTAGSLEAAKAYAEAQDLQWSGKWAAATDAYKKALALDPQMGRAYSGLAVVAFNSGNKTAANEYFQEAMAHIGRMSERERYRTRGLYYLEERDVPKAIDEYTQLLKKYPADSAGHANLALAYFYMRDMQRALQEGMQSVVLSPKNVPQLNNVGLYAMYAGEFDRAIAQQDRVLELNPRFNLAYVCQALSKLAMNRDGVANTWETLAHLNAQGASQAAQGLADLAMYHGRISDAVKLLRKGADDDLAANNKDEAAVKWATIAHAEAYRNGRTAAIAAADRALQLSQDDGVRVLAAEAYVSSGAAAKTLPIAAELEGKLENDSRAYARLIGGMRLLKAGKSVPAINELNEAQKISDTWLGHYYLGRAYLEAKAYAEADSEFDTCLRRNGEATAIFLDEEPTYHLIPLVNYYDGMAREGLHSPSAERSFQAFLTARSGSQEDPLVREAMRHVTKGEAGTQAR